MTRKRTLPTITKPFAYVHNTLTTLGFMKIPSREGTLYELKFRDPTTQKEYPYRICTYTKENGQTLINLNEACFCGKEEYISASAAVAADEMLAELQQYLENGLEKSTSKPILEVMNGKMANNEAEVKKLGKVMASLPTNSQLLQNGMIPDPIQ